ncbi:hypothetical protein B0H10DRAFT_2230765 [Mycena sp. CBHHK59/15]|nr:hypothetical protein B0H10DRAFT_2230765 [Mycena sp. CBHHK59/15]
MKTNDHYNVCAKKLASPCLERCSALADARYHHLGQDHLHEHRAALRIVLNPWLIVFSY